MINQLLVKTKTTFLKESVTINEDFLINEKHEHIVFTFICKTISSLITHFSDE